MRNTIVQSVYSAKNKEELEKLYDKWAKNYDKDMELDYSWLGPEYTVKFLTKYVKNTEKILDAGCGTGIIGELLHQKKFNNITGIDLSQKMLEEAEKKQVYSQLLHLSLEDAYKLEPLYFDAIISVGVFTLGHAAPEAIKPLLTSLKSKG